MDMPNLQDRIILSIGSDARQISWLGEAIYAITRAATTDEKGAMELQVALIEALNNVFLYAYDGEPAHPITVIWQWDKQTLRIQILDQGHTLDSLPKAELPDVLSENGRGWWIIGNCVDGYFYQAREFVATASQYGITEKYYNKLTLIKNFNPSIDH